MKKEAWDIISQIIAAIGSLATFGAFIFLFRRDKDKQEQINRLTGIADVLKSQNDTWKEHNFLIEQQVNIFRNTSILKEGDSEAINRLHEIEEKKLKLSVRPDIKTNGGGYSGQSGEFRIVLINNGEKATLLEIKLNSSDVLLHSIDLPYELEKGRHINISGRANGSKHIQYSDYQIDMIYKDKLDNKYICQIKGHGASAEIVTDNEM